MLNMIIPMAIVTIGYFLARFGSDTNIRLFTIIGVILIIVAFLWFFYNLGYNIGYKYL